MHEKGDVITMKKFNKLYTYEIIKSTGHGLQFKRDENGYLYADRQYKTKINDTDLPEYFVRGYLYHVHGFISAKDVKHLVYCPNYNYNHWLKYDFLYISYDDEITFEQSEVFDYKYPVGARYTLSGNIIYDFINAVEKYSDYDLSAIKKEIKLHLLYFNARYEKDYNDDIYTEIEIKDEELQELLDKDSYYIQKKYIK